MGISIYNSAKLCYIIAVRACIANIAGAASIFRGETHGLITWYDDLLRT